MHGAGSEGFGQLGVAWRFMAIMKHWGRGVVARYWSILNCLKSKVEKVADWGSRLLQPPTGL